MIKDLKTNDVITGIFVLTKREVGTTKNGQPYAKLCFEDASGTLNGVLWDKLFMLDPFNVGDIVQVSCVIESYNSALQAKVQGLSKPDPNQVDLSTLFPSSKYDVQQMLSEIIDLAKSIQDAWLSKLIHCFYSNSDFLKKLRNHPAAKSVHHAYSGGLLQHTLNVARLTDHACSIYTESRINRDLAVTVALLHDIGKLHELQPLPTHEYTMCGNLIGHVIESQNMVRDACNGIPEFPVELRDLMCHCILAHHGELEFGSPKVPMCTEALIVHCCDLLDSRVEICDKFYEANEKTLQQDRITPYCNALGTRLTASYLFE